MLQPSRSLAALVTAAHSLAGVAVLSILEGIPALLVLAGIAISLAWCIAKSMLWLPGNIAQFEILADGAAGWSDRKGGNHSAKSIQAGWCSEYLLIVGLQGADSKWHWMILLPDAAEAESLRTLRVWFRWHYGGIIAKKN